MYIFNSIIIFTVDVALLWLCSNNIGRIFMYTLLQRTVRMIKTNGGMCTSGNIIYILCWCETKTTSFSDFTRARGDRVYINMIRRVRTLYHVMFVSRRHYIIFKRFGSNIFCCGRSLCAARVPATVTDAVCWNPSRFPRTKYVRVYNTRAPCGRSRGNVHWVQLKTDNIRFPTDKPRR